MGPPEGVLLRGEVQLQPRAVGYRAARPTPVRSVPREHFRQTAVGDAVRERPELGRVVPGAARHPDRERRTGRRPGENVELGEVPARLGIVVRPPRAGTEEDEARGIDREDFLHRPGRTCGRREERSASRGR